MKLPPLKQFMNTTEECHAFINGFLEVLCPWPPRKPMAEDYYYRIIENEYHYYLAGRASAVIAWLAIAKLIQVIFW